MKRTALTILAVLAVAGCNSPQTATPEPRQGAGSSEIELSGGASVVVIKDDLTATTTFILEGISLETDGMSLVFQPEVIWNSEGQPSARIRFEGTIYGPRWSATIPQDQTVLPVITGTVFIRLIGDRASVSFFREHALEFADNVPGSADPYRFQALFSLEPPVMKNILAADEFILVGENPEWRLQLGDSQKDACRRFLDISLGNDSAVYTDTVR
ncbi:MAG: hypothetical protein R6V62_03500 [Candidatus Fermentibacteraceae bacterium]